MTGIFTLDATVALAIAAVILSMAVFLVAEPKKQANEQLYQLSADVLAVAEGRNVLQALVNDDYSGWIDLRSAIPSRVCLRLRIRNESGSLVYTEQSDCTTEGDYSVTRRTFVCERRFYSAEMRAWMR